MSERTITNEVQQTLNELGNVWQPLQEGYLKDSLTEDQNRSIEAVFTKVEDLDIEAHLALKTLFQNTKTELRQDLLNHWAGVLTEGSIVESLEELVETAKALMAIQYEYHLQNPFESGLSD